VAEAAAALAPLEAGTVELAAEPEADFEALLLSVWLVEWLLLAEELD